MSVKNKKRTIKTYPHFALVLIWLTSLFACSKEEVALLVPFELCNRQQPLVWSTPEPENALLGEWQWGYSSCFWKREAIDIEAYAGLVVEMKADYTLVFKEKGQPRRTAAWKLVRDTSDSSYLTLETTPWVPTLDGWIRLCDSTVTFGSSYLDGCDHFFKRKVAE